MLPIAKRCGVTRLADITGLDRIGVPVTAVIRPNSLTLATASGKGLTKATAKVSGIMEPIELYHAENVILPSFLETYNRLPGGIAKIELPLLPLKKNSLFNPDWPEYCFERFHAVKSLSFSFVVFAPLREAISLMDLLRVLHG
ncbi:MAG: hypothetical protein HZA01_09745 [Nitrospinae bacterium]|nr:hypothetical protein [Nitrospinota bacterium]